jgi:hypothetical protein
MNSSRTPTLKQNKQKKNKKKKKKKKKKTRREKMDRITKEWDSNYKEKSKVKEGHIVNAP